MSSQGTHSGPGQAERRGRRGRGEGGGGERGKGGKCALAPTGTRRDRDHLISCPPSKPTALSLDIRHPHQITDNRDTARRCSVPPIGNRPPEEQWNIRTSGSCATIVVSTRRSQFIAKMNKRGGRIKIEGRRHDNKTTSLQTSGSIEIINHENLQTWFRLRGPCGEVEVGNNTAVWRGNWENGIGG